MFHLPTFHLSQRLAHRLSHCFLAALVIPVATYCVRNSAAHERQLECLTDNAYYEVRGEPTEAQKRQVWLTIARAADHKEWGRLPCETVYQKSKSGTYQYSWVPMVHPDPKTYAKVRAVVEEVYADPAKGAPAKGRCARYYKRTDNKGVSEKSKKWFETALQPVEQFGSHTAYCDKVKR